MIFEKLTEKEKEMILYSIQTWGPGDAYVHDLPTMNRLQYLLRFWEQNKTDYLYEWLGENLIVEKHISYMTPDAKMHTELSRALSRGGALDAFTRKFYKCLERIYPFWSNERGYLCDLISADNLISNTYRSWELPSEGFIFEYGDNKVKLVEGAKTMRLLGKVAKLFDLEKDFEEFRLEHSRILNKKKLEGTLCLSIHPMDYITMSDNASKWSSCMSWNSSGGYRRGTVEMMNSPMVIVAYLKSENKEYNVIPNTHNWNDKHWRALIITSPTGIISVKGYPYDSIELSTMCVEWLRELAAANTNYKFNDVVSVPYETTFEYVDGNSYYVSPETGEAMYNDFGCADHIGCFAVNAPELLDHSTWISERPLLYAECYSGESECMCCGNIESDIYFEEEGYLFCENCIDYRRDYVECRECGDEVHEDEAYWIEDDAYCYGCLRRIAEYDVLTDQYEYKENIVKVYLARENDKPNLKTDYYFNTHVYHVEDHNSILRRWDYTKIDNPHVIAKEDSDPIYYLNREDMTDKGYRLFELYTSEERDNYFNS